MNDPWRTGPFAGGPAERDARLRRDAGAILGAAIAAAEPRMLVARALDAGSIGFNDSDAAATILAFGKAAAAMAAAAHEALGRRVASGVVVTPGSASYEPGVLERLAGGHPLPDERSIAAARAIEAAARDAAAAGRDILCLISGGASALLAAPSHRRDVRRRRSRREAAPTRDRAVRSPAISLDAIRETTDLLLKAGAPIEELNAVRKHLDRLKGGGLARVAAPSRVIGFVLSDVPGDPLDVIASGPLSPDPTTYADAIDVLARRGVLAAVPVEVRRHLERGRAGELPETPKPGDPIFERVELRVIGNAATAAEAASAEAQRLGYSVDLRTTTLRGVARDVGAEIAAGARRLGAQTAAGQGEVSTSSTTRIPPTSPACLIAAGETTVVVRGSGKGGRCQELALAAALVLDGVGGVLVAAVGTDGIDGPTDAAGAVATGATVTRARQAGLRARERLDDNDAYPVFAALDDLVITGPTGTNVNDIVIALAR